MNSELKTKREAWGVKSQILLIILLLLLLLPVMSYASPRVGSSRPTRVDSTVQQMQSTTGERIAEWLRMKGLSPEVVVFLVAMLPIVELRGAVPIGNNFFALPLYKTLFLSIVGNMVPIILVLLFLERLVSWLGHIPLFRQFFAWLFQRTRKKSGVIARFEFWGVVIFVGIPLPMTGAWTGSIAAVLLGMPYWHTLLAIFLGVLIAAGIVTALSLLGFWGLVIAVVGLSAIVAYQVLAGKREARLHKG